MSVYLVHNFDHCVDLEIDDPLSIVVPGTASL